MPRIRTIKPEFWTDEKTVELSMAARLLFIGIWNFVDDEGRMEFSPKRIKMQIFPSDSVEIDKLCAELRRLALVFTYSIQGKEYLQVTNFSKHQKIDKRRNSKYPAPNCAELRRLSPTEEEEEEEEEKEEEKEENKPTLPSSKTREKKSQKTSAVTKPSWNPVAVFCEEYKKIHRSAYTVLGPDAAALKALSKTIPKEERFRAICRAFVSDDDLYLAGKGYPAREIGSRINKYTKQIAYTAAKKEEYDESKIKNSDGKPFDFTVGHTTTR